MPLLPLSALLSQVLVAYTVELDNLAELRLQHTTTRERAGYEGASGPPVRGPWLVSWPLWANVLQYVGPEGIRVDELHDRARTSRTMLGGLRRWRYVLVEPPAGEPLRTPPQAAAIVRRTAAATRSQEIWRQLPDEMEGRWRGRFGSPAVGRLAGALGTVYAALPIDPPAYLPVVFPTQNGRTEHPPATVLRAHDPPADLAALLSGVLHAFTIDFEAVSRISLPIGANTLRVIDGDGVRVRDLPVRTGVSKEANAMCTGWLERHGCAELLREPGAARGKVVRLTDKGRHAQRRFAQALRDTEQAWCTTYGGPEVAELRAALTALTGDGKTIASSPLAPGLQPASRNWRARVRASETLPHYPMVLHRGGYPDGS